MEVTINGQSETVDSETVGALLKARDLDPKTVVVELNLKILPRENYASSMLRDGDSIEIVQFVGGG